MLIQRTRSMQLVECTYLIRRTEYSSPLSRVLIQSKLHSRLSSCACTARGASNNIVQPIAALCVVCDRNAWHTTCPISLCSWVNISPGSYRAVLWTAEQTAHAALAAYIPPRWAGIMIAAEEQKLPLSRRRILGRRSSFISSPSWS